MSPAGWIERSLGLESPRHWNQVLLQLKLIMARRARQANARTESLTWSKEYHSISFRFAEISLTLSDCASINNWFFFSLSKTYWGRSLIIFVQIQTFMYSAARGFHYNKHVIFWVLDNCDAISILFQAPEILWATYGSDFRSKTRSLCFVCMLKVRASAQCERYRPKTMWENRFLHLKRENMTIPFLLMTWKSGQR